MPDYLIGAVDGIHLPILKPSLNARDYWGRYRMHTVACQGVLRLQGGRGDLTLPLPVVKSHIHPRNGQAAIPLDPG